MKHLKTFNQVNEEASLFKKIRQGIGGYKKSDMYIAEKFPKPTAAEITPDKLFYGKSVPELELEVLNTIIVKNLYDKGVFIRETTRWGNEYKFRDNIYGSNTVWFDQSYHFDKLKKISNALGYKVGKQVDIIGGGYGQISEIVNFAFYNIKELISCNEKLTLLYKVDEVYYQITQIELSKEIKSNIVDDVIRENFYDLIDDETISYSSTPINNVFKCAITVNDLTDISVLSKISDSLSVAQNRLKDSNINLTITNISKSHTVGNQYNIYFTCVPMAKR